MQYKCEICDKDFPNTLDRCMEHCHETGEFRNIVCRRCNAKKFDRKIHSNSGYKHIYKQTRKGCKQGYIYTFSITEDSGKRKTIKTSIDLDKLIHFRDKWIIDKNYHT